MQESKPAIAPEVIADYGSERLLEINAPIFSAETYPDGLYASFEEFRDNTPSITDGYEIRDGDPLKARWVDNEGKKTRVRDNVYAIAHANRLYIFFDGSFYPVEKTPRGLFFDGPVVANNSAIIAGGIMGGMIGGAIAGAASARKMRYRINLSNGSLHVY